MAKDPVCGMAVREGAAETSEFEGRTYLFCSPVCKSLFDRSPQSYVEDSPGETGEASARERTIAYFSMEIGVDSRMPTYSGGLGVLAGDTLRAFADAEVPVVAITLLYRRGYFFQKLYEDGRQDELPVEWHPEDHLQQLPETAEVEIEGRRVAVRAWRYDVLGAGGFPVPVIFLDTDLEENSPADRELTDRLYGGDERHRLAQEVVLGIGGVRLLRAIGWTQIERYHLNEGHAGLLTLELLRESRRDEEPTWDFSDVRRRCVFTTHTPVPAGHDKFSYDLAGQVLGETMPLDILRMLGGEPLLNMTSLALNMSHYINGVAKQHGQVSQRMFPGYPIHSITNGVHSVTWTSDSFRELFDRSIPGWRADSATLRYSVQIPKNELWQAHQEAKMRLVDFVNRKTNAGFDYETLTIGFARRATAYKRPDLVFRDPIRLRSISRESGRLQLLFAGKAHPRDQGGKDLIQRIVAMGREMLGDVRVAYLPGYDMDLARLLISGVDLWLNTPRKPMEASGTSGMKAAHNGVPSLSVLDGWWLEGHIEGVTGWSIGSREVDSASDDAEAGELYDKLERIIVPLFYQRRDEWMDVMRNSIAFNASFFNTQRMVQQYGLNAYVR